MFPRIEEACNDTAHNLTKNVEQHAGFAAQLNASWLYVRACRANLTPPPKVSPVPPPTEEELRADPADHGLDPKLGFQPQAFRAEMDKWLLPLAVHLEEEIVTLDPKWIEKMGEPEFIRQGKATEKYLQSYDPAWFLVSAIGESALIRYKRDDSLLVQRRSLRARVNAQRHSRSSHSSAHASPKDPAPGKFYSFPHKLRVVLYADRSSFSGPPSTRVTGSTVAIPRSVAHLRP